jgi:hypothetical protein
MCCKFVSAFGAGNLQLFCLCVGYFFLVRSHFNMFGNGCVYETFGISKRFPIKLQLLLIRAVLLDKPLTAKCFIHVVSRSVFIFLSFLSISFCSIMSFTKHFTILYVSCTAFTPCSNVVGIHFSKFPNFCLVGIVTDCT